MKDPGAVENPNHAVDDQPHHACTATACGSCATDGRNTPGVDVPYPFDGALTVTALGRALTGDFTLVRVQAKVEAPLRRCAVRRRAGDLDDRRGHVLRARPGRPSGERDGNDRRRISPTGPTRNRGSGAGNQGVLT